MDRTLVYPGQVPRALDNLLLGRYAMTGIAKLAEAVLGTSPVVPAGSFTVTPATGLNIAVGAGQIYQLQSIEPITESALGVDGHQVLKQGIALDAQTLTLAPPSSVGYAQNFLIQVAYQDIPTGQVVLSFQNPTPVLDPATGAYKYVTYPGPGGNGQASYTILQGSVSVSAKPGVAAASGSQTTPAPDTGYVGLYVVTLAYGASSISNGNISLYASAPFMPVTLPGVPVAVQANTWSYAVASGTNALTASLTPNPPALVDGLSIALYCPNTNTAGATLALNGYPAAPIVRRDGTSIQSGDITAGMVLRLTYKSGQWGFVSIANSDISTSIVTSPYAGTRAVVPITASQTWVVPANVFYLKRVTLWGSGGSGGGSTGSGGAGSGGGGGGYSVKFNIAVTPGQQIPVTIGIGGGTSGAGNGGTGSSTSFGNIFYATGGGPGTAGTNALQTSSNGQGGSGNGGDVNVTGSQGSFGYAVGSAAASGIGGSSPFGASIPNLNIASGGNNGNFPGGGSNGGSAGGYSGVAANGFCLIEY